MQVPASLDPETLADLVAHLARVRHDLGRYVVFQQRWLAPDADAAERREALASDLLATRRGPDGSVDAVAVWAELRRALVGEASLVGGGRVDLSGDPDLASLDAAMREIEALIPALRAGVDDAGVERGSLAAASVSRACDALWRRWRTGVT